MLLLQLEKMHLHKKIVVERQGTLRKMSSRCPGHRKSPWRWRVLALRKCRRYRPLLSQAHGRWHCPRCDGPSLTSGGSSGLQCRNGDHIPRVERTVLFGVRIITLGSAQTAGIMGQVMRLFLSSSYGTCRSPVTAIQVSYEHIVRDLASCTCQ